MKPSLDRPCFSRRTQRIALWITIGFPIYLLSVGPVIRLIDDGPTFTCRFIRWATSLDPAQYLTGTFSTFGRWTTAGTSPSDREVTP